MAGESASEVFTLTIAPILGFLLANVMFFASVPELQKYRKMNEWGSLNSHPYPIVVCNCIGWMMYGSVIKDSWVFVSNVPGLLVSVYALMIALTLNARNEKKRGELEKMVLVSCALLSVMGFVVGVVMHDGGDEKEGKKRFASGIFCNVVLAIYYASPLSEMRQIITERDASSLYWPMSVAITVNGFSWAAYGFALKDWFLVSPNMFGGVLGVVQLAFLATFGKKNTKKKKMNKSSSISSVKIELEERGGGEEEEEEEEINIVANLSSEDLIVSGQPRS